MTSRYDTEHGVRWTRRPASLTPRGQLSEPERNQRLESWLDWPRAIEPGELDRLRQLIADGYNAHEARAIVLGEDFVAPPQRRGIPLWFLVLVVALSLALVFAPWERILP